MYTLPEAYIQGSQYLMVLFSVWLKGQSAHHPFLVSKGQNLRPVQIESIWQTTK